LTSNVGPHFLPLISQSKSLTFIATVVVLQL